MESVVKQNLSIGYIQYYVPARVAWFIQSIKLNTITYIILQDSQGKKFSYHKVNSVLWCQTISPKKIRKLSGTARL